AAAGGAFTLLCGRLVQAIGAGCGITLVRTVASDAYGAEHLIKAIAYLTMFYTIGPMIAPAVGGGLDHTLGWRRVFRFALLMGGAIMAATYFVIYETRPRSEAGTKSDGILRSYGTLFVQPVFTAFVLQSGLNSATFMTVASASSSLLKELLNRPSAEFG